MALIPLPIDEVLPALIDAVERCGNAVLVAPTGSGKTTRVPGGLLDAGLAEHRAVVMLEPRRMAARAAARRIAEERGVAIGEEVGWQVRFEKRSSSRTRILVLTEGLLVRKLQDDPFLEDVGVVILDEFHERSQFADLSLAMVRRLQQEVRPDLRIVAMSATLDAERLSLFLGNCPIIVSEGRRFPVDISYLKYPEVCELPERAAKGVRQLLRESDGDLLCFLPGVQEIRATENLLSRDAVNVQCLYGDLSPELQDRILISRGERRVILATNVAETSLTIPGIQAVVDTGYARVNRKNSESGLNRLVLERISRASADQRAGRAGREAPGKCLRLWTEREQAALTASIEPEICRVDLASAVLELSCWGENPELFPWYESPDSLAMQATLQELRLLGIMDHSGPTSLGRMLVRWPVHPRIGRLLVEAVQRGVLEEGLCLAALLSERNPFARQAAEHRSFSDAFDQVDRLMRLEKRMIEGDVRAVLQVRDRLREQVCRDLSSSKRVLTETEREHGLAKAILAAWPDRVCQQREDGRRGRLLGGRGVRLHPQSACDESWFIALDVDDAAVGRGAEAIVRMASGILPEWLPTTEAVEVCFDHDLDRVTAIRRRRYGDLIVSEAQVALPDPEFVADVLRQAAMERWKEVVPWDLEEFAGLVARWQCLTEWCPELELPACDEALLISLIPDLCLNKRSFEELRLGPWAETLFAQLPWSTRQKFEQLVPSQIQVPSGSWIPLIYQVGRPPILAVKIQELFGLTDTPRIVNGRIKVLLHLLAPNRRPQQVTDDLASFWKNIWPEVRKELRSRYPKHSWPEDPWNAVPEARPKRRLQ